MTKKIFIWVAHPKAGSLNEGIAEAYRRGAEDNGAEVRQMNLAEMHFDMDHFIGYDDNKPPLDEDLRKWQENIAWADHIFIVHPYWWGAMPAKAKAVLDLALTPGFAFKYHGNGLKWDKLLKGKTADFIVTSDTPPWMDTWLYWMPGRRVMKNQVLGFTGIKTRKARQIGSIVTASEKKIRKWISSAQLMGLEAAA